MQLKTNNMVTNLKIWNWKTIIRGSSILCRNRALYLHLYHRPFAKCWA